MKEGEFIKLAVKDLWKVLLTVHFFSVSVVLAGPVKRHYTNFAYRHNDSAGQIGEIDGNKWWMDLNYSYYYRKPFVDREAKVEIETRYNDANFLQFSLKEASITHLWNNAEVSYGRILVDWVEIDSVWGLGKINNRVNFDFFRPGQEGLFGFRYKHQISKKFMIDFYGSPLHVPELNPPLNIDSDRGTITSKSPWAQVPDATADISGNPVTLFYDVNTPDIGDILFNESYGINFRFSPREDLHLTSFFLRKPENGLSNTAQVEYVPATDRAEVNVNPQIFYHTLYGAQITWEPNRSWKLYASYYTSIPGDKPVDDSLIVDNDIGVGISIEKFQERYFGTGFHYHGESLRGGFSFLNRVSDFEKTNILTQIPRWSQAVNAVFDYIYSQTLRFSMDLKYDTLTFDRLYSLSVVYKPDYQWELIAGADIIGTPDVGDGYWVVFRDNDSIFAQVKYLF